MTNFAQFHVADSGGVNVTVTGQTTTSQRYNLYLPDPDIAGPQPAAGWPWFAQNQSSGYASTAILGNPATLINPGGVVPQETLLGELLCRGIAIALIDVTGPWLTGDTPTTTHPVDASALPGLGLSLPADFHLTADGGEDPALSDAWNDIDKLAVFSDYMLAVQHVKFTFGAGTGTGVIDKNKVVYGGTSGSGSSAGSSSATIALLLASLPDLKFASLTGTDFRGESTRALGCYAANFQYWLQYDQTTGDMGNTAGAGPTAGLGSFMPFPSVGNLATKIADKFSEVPQQVQRWFSPLYQLARSSAQRQLNGKDVNYYLYFAGFSQGGTTIGRDSGGTNVTSTGFQGFDASETGKLPVYSAPLDAATAVALDLNTNRHAPAFGYDFMERLVGATDGIERDGWHSQRSFLYVDADTDTAAAATAGFDASLAQTKNFAVTGTAARVLNEANFIQDTLAGIVPSVEA